MFTYRGIADCSKHYDKSFIYGDLYHHGKLVYIIEQPDRRYIKVDPSTIGVSSNLTDENNRNIYTGDFLGDENGNIVPFEVVFENGAFRAKSEINSGNTVLNQERTKRMLILGNSCNNNVDDFIK